MASPAQLAKVNEVAVLRTYRHLLRATYIAFKGMHLYALTTTDCLTQCTHMLIHPSGDIPTLTASRKFARDSFNTSRKLENGSVEAGQAIAHAQSVTKILRENVVQGTDMGDDKYKLNIHQHTERGDNATAKAMQGSVKSFKDIKNAQF